MNSSMSTSDRATHIKIVTTAVLATALVIAIGIFAKPPSDARQQAVTRVAGHAVFATIDHGRIAAR